MVTAKLIKAFVIAKHLVQFFYFLNTKFQASIHLLSLYSPVCIGPGWKPRRPVFSQRGSIDSNEPQQKPPPWNGRQYSGGDALTRLTDTQPRPRLLQWYNAYLVIRSVWFYDPLTNEMIIAVNKLITDNTLMKRGRGHNRNGMFIWISTPQEMEQKCIT